MLLFARNVKMVDTDETNKSTRIIVTFILTCVIASLPRMDVYGFASTINFVERHKMIIYLKKCKNVRESENILNRTIFFKTKITLKLNN